MSHRFRRRRRGGFTLLEVMLVLAILVILGGTVGFYMAGMQKKSYEDAARTQIGNLERAVEAFRLDTGRIPSAQSGLSGLVAAPADLPNPKKWRGPYLSQSTVPKDPWDGDYVYTPTGTTYTIISAGEDGAQGTADDVKLHE